MATIRANTSERTFQIKKWLGLHENPDGDTKLALGEAAAIKNFRITRDGNLQRRPGYAEFAKAGTGRVAALWAGRVNGKEVFLAAMNSKVYNLWDAANSKFYDSPHDITGGVSVDTSVRVHIFGFEKKAYFMNGVNYYVWDGTTFSAVTGYIPLVRVSIEPSPNSGMGGAALEQVNKLSAYRKVWLSPDGTGKVFYLPENNIAAVDEVRDLATDTVISASTYTVSLTDGTVSFTNAPAQAVNGIQVTYHMSTSYASTVKAMRFSELFSGQTDSRVFIYGDGSNQIFYSGIDYFGKPRADYFPDLNVASIGDENTPVTALIRHYSKLVVFKLDSAWNVSFDTTTLSNGNITEALYIYPTNKRIGHMAPGQIALVLNAPRSLFGNDIYEWRNNNSYSANLSVDERQAKRISDRVYSTLSTFNFEECFCWDDNDAQEYWVTEPRSKRALIHNYAADAWYFYTGLDIYSMCSFHGKLYFGMLSSGTVCCMDEIYNSDDGDVIEAVWESGSMDFGQDYMRKYSATTWLGIKPTGSGRIEAAIMTDRRSLTKEKVVTSKLSNFSNVNFGAWSFNTNQMPHIKRLKIKAKKFVYYKLFLKNDDLDTSAIVTSVDIKVRYTSQAK